ncbi:ATP-binding protein [Xylanivirga thermophila]|uniref:ATP-binding protein n=1 Tax=Xylanivirga thermophila TaxID=2496273 RepID=UPI001FB23CD1|nr:ATP-binding protein [Xylanivirga thermophila]
MQNSIVANATLIIITIKEDIKTDKLIVSVEDNGMGMDKETINRVIDPFYTTRTTRRVGLGIPLLKAAAELSGGCLNIYSEKGKGTAIMAVFGLSNIDRPPLGDMEDTVATLILCNPYIDFIYRHSTPGGQFELDTRAVKQQLGEVPICNSQVIDWIREYIKEGINQIGGGAIV